MSSLPAPSSPSVPSSPSGSAPSSAPSSTPFPALSEIFPPFGLAVHAGDLTLRLFTDADFPEYAALLREPIFDDPEAEYVFPWYRVDPEQRVRESLRFQWRLRAQIQPDDWTLTFGIWAGGRLIGSQDLGATKFATRRAVTSGSWLTRSAHGQGYGKLMRQAVLVLAFDHLGASRAESSASVHNARSIAVSRACGYVDNGTEVSGMYDSRVVEQKFLVTPETFQRPAVGVEVEGLNDELKAMLAVTS